MNFIMSRDRTVVSKFGRAFEFKKHEPLHVPEMCWPEVEAAGGAPETELPEDENAVEKAPQGAARTKVLVESIRKMVMKGERNDFTGTGAPNAAVLSALAGFTVDAKERDSAWALAQNDKE
jgi:hypothetical protein